MCFANTAVGEIGDCMRLFYVDFENVQRHGMRGISGLNETDKVLVLYSVNATTVKFSIVDEIMRSKAKIVLKEATVGTPNALDANRTQASTRRSRAGLVRPSES